MIQVQSNNNNGNTKREQNKMFFDFKRNQEDGPIYKQEVEKLKNSISRLSSDNKTDFQKIHSKNGSYLINVDNEYIYILLINQSFNNQSALKLLREIKSIIQQNNSQVNILAGDIHKIEDLMISYEQNPHYVSDQQYSKSQKDKIQSALENQDTFVDQEEKSDDILFMPGQFQKQNNQVKETNRIFRVSLGLIVFILGIYQIIQKV